jgi:hypothetical protein
MPESSTTGYEPVTRYEFPEKQPQFYTRLVLRKYSRPRPNSAPSKNISGSIRLPLPNQLNDQYGMDVNSNQPLGLLGNINGGDLNETKNRMLAAGKSAAEAYKNAFMSGNKGAISQLAFKTVALSPGISDLVGAVLPGVSGQQVQAFASAEAGVVRNPHLTSIFEGVRLKSYEFTWRLSPKSEAEAKKLNHMINYIKAFMHPAILQNSGGFALEYPYIANVQFEGLPAEVTPNVNDSFITGMNIHSSSGNGVALFRDGQPVFVDLSLHFQEININTRESFGYGTSQSMENPTPPSSSQTNGDRMR